MNPQHLAILLLVVGNALALISDMFVKAYSGTVPPAQFVLLRTLVTLVMLLPFYKLIQWQDWRQGLAVQILRALISVLGTACMVIALNHLPLATANAIFYAAPILVMVFAAIWLGETLTIPAIVSVSLGFLGVLVILQPAAFGLYSLAAVGVAFALALNIVLVRKLPPRLSLWTILWFSHLWMLPFLIVLSSFQWQPVSLEVWMGAFGSAAFILCYNGAVVVAYRLAEANKVTSSEYTGLLWAILLGWWGFGEVPDWTMLVGSLLIIGPLYGLNRSPKRLPSTQLDG